MDFIFTQSRCFAALIPAVTFRPRNLLPFGNPAAAPMGLIFHVSYNHSSATRAIYKIIIYIYKFKLTFCALIRTRPASVLVGHRINRPSWSDSCFLLFHFLTLLIQINVAPANNGIFKKAYEFVATIFSNDFVALPVAN